MGYLKNEQQMKDIMDYAADNDITIQEACMLYQTVCKEDLYDDISGLLHDQNHLSIEIYTNESHPIEVSMDASVDCSGDLCVQVQEL